MPVRSRSPAPTFYIIQLTSCISPLPENVAASVPELPVPSFATKVSVVLGSNALVVIVPTIVNETREYELTSSKK